MSIRRRSQILSKRTRRLWVVAVPSSAQHVRCLRQVETIGAACAAPTLVTWWYTAAEFLLHELERFVAQWAQREGWPSSFLIGLAAVLNVSFFDSPEQDQGLIDSLQETRQVVSFSCDHQHERCRSLPTRCHFAMTAASASNPHLGSSLIRNISGVATLAPNQHWHQIEVLGFHAQVKATPKTRGHLLDG